MKVNTPGRQSLERKKFLAVGKAAPSFIFCVRCTPLQGEHATSVADIGQRGGACNTGELGHLSMMCAADPLFVTKETKPKN